MTQRMLVSQTGMPCQVLLAELGQHRAVTSLHIASNFNIPNSQLSLLFTTLMLAAHVCR
jgi:hypothetical protein